MPNRPLLQLRGLKTWFELEDASVPAVDGVDLQVNEGETLALVGESGSGKSVLSLSVLGLVPPPGRIVEGEILFDGIDLTKLSEEARRRRRGSEIGMVFQDPMTSLNPVIRVGEQIAEGIRLHQNLDRRAAEARAVELLELVGIPDAAARHKAFPHQLSGGMRQRVMIAMALSCDPRLLIADEPTTALDVTIQAQVLELLREIQERLGLGILFITHDLGVVAEIADRVAVMYAGRIVEEAPVADLFNHPRMPYTAGLLRSVPRLDTRAGRLASIEGTVPPPHRRPPGCPFHTRCDHRVDRCAESLPPLELVSAGHSVRCFRAAELELTAVSGA